MKVAEWMELEEQTVLQLYPRAKILLTKGKGMYLQDAGGKRYLDFLGGIAVQILGHCHPKVVAAIRDQAGKLIHTSNLYYTVPYIKAARLLHKISKKKAFFCNSGAEAIEALLKFARKWGQAENKYKILCEEGSFHGRTMGSLTMTGQNRIKRGFAPLLPGVDHFPFEDIKALEQKADEKTAAVLLEPIQGERGVFPHSRDFLKRVEELCRKKNILFFLDEIQTGLCRTGHWFAYQFYGVEPDGLALAKGLGGGLPFACVLVNEKVARSLEIGDHATTFGGNPVAAKSCVALLDTMMRENIRKNVQEMGKELENALSRLKDIGAIAEIRRVGLMVGITLTRPFARSLAERCLQNGLIIHATSEQNIRLLPPLIIKKKHIREAVQIMERSWEEVSHGKKNS